jgi:hypothetical protein
VVAEQDGAGGDAVLLGNLDDDGGGEDGGAGAAEGAVGHDVDALGLAEVDDLVLRQAGVVLDLVDGGDDGGLGQELLEVELAVLRGGQQGARWEKKRGRTLQTPMALTLPVARSFSIDFQVLMWEWEWTMSRLPSGLVGNLSWLPGGSVSG